jgi:hypothetical protein
MTVSEPTAERGPMQSSHDGTGARFTHVYLQTTEMLPDSKRARFRVAHLLAGYELGHLIPRVIERELGVPVNYGLEVFLNKCELGDFLDL